MEDIYLQFSSCQDIDSLLSCLSSMLSILKHSYNAICIQYWELTSELSSRKKYQLIFQEDSSTQNETKTQQQQQQQRQFQHQQQRHRQQFQQFQKPSTSNTSSNTSHSIVDFEEMQSLLSQAHTQRNSSSSSPLILFLFSKLFFFISRVSSISKIIPKIFVVLG